MINLYELHNSKELDNYSLYGKLISNLIQKEYSEYGPILHIIKKSPEYSYWYASRCLYNRWIEAEPVIKKNDILWSKYCRKFDISH